MRKIVLAAASLCCTTLALAQSATDAATKERMERARRDASNPLRIIIEASQVKRTKAAETPTAAPAPATAPVAARAAEPRAERRPARTVEQASAAEPANRAQAQQTRAGGAAADASGPAASTAPGPDAAVADAAPATGGVPAASSLGAVPAAGLAAAAAPSASAAPNAAQPAAEVLAPLKLVHYIEPEIPVRIRARLRPTNEVTVGFKVQPDGSVSEVGIRATTARALDPVVLDAVKQWRYDPVREPREHTVQLVFNLTE